MLSIWQEPNCSAISLWARDLRYTYCRNFPAQSLIPQQWWFIPVDFALALAFLLDFAVRLYADRHLRTQLLNFAVLSDLVVIVSHCFRRLSTIAFLRVLRTVRLLRSDRVRSLKLILAFLTWINAAPALQCIHYCVSPRLFPYRS